MATSYYDQLLEQQRQNGQIGAGMPVSVNENNPQDGYGAATSQPVQWAGGPAPAVGSSGTTRAAAPGLGSSMANTYVGSTYGGGGGGSLGGYELPGSAAAAQSLRDLQMQATSGLSGLVNRDTTAARKKIEDALYASSAQGINTAAERARMAMLEGTFARGVGPSSITVELAGRGQQEHADALAKAARDAFTQAGSEDRADLASQLAALTSSGSLATSGLQGEANVALANLARQLQESQFSRNLQFQGSENAANRAQQAGQFGQNLGLQYAQLAQQGGQFDRNLAFTGQQNQANRDLTTSEAALNRALQQMLLESQQTFSGGQAQLNRDFTGEQNQAARDAAAALQASSQNFTGEQNQYNRELTTSESALNRTLQQLILDSQQNFAGTQNQLGRDFTGQQNQAQRDANMQALLLQLANSQDLAKGSAISGGIGAGVTGLSALFGPFLAQYLKSITEG